MTNSPQKSKMIAQQKGELNAAFETGKEPVHLEYVLTRVTTRRESFTRYIVDYQRIRTGDWRLPWPACASQTARSRVVWKRSEARGVRPWLRPGCPAGPALPDR